MNQSLPLLWLPGLLCDQQLFEPVNALLPERVAPECASLDVADSMQRSPASYWKRHRRALSLVVCRWEGYWLSKSTVRRRKG